MAGGCGFFKRCGGKIAVFAADQRGAVLPFVAAIILAVIGFGTLAMDIPRFADLQTQLQSAADAFALAGAAELDGRSDAQTRANTAINTLMTSRNSSFSGKSAAAVTVQSISYYASLPATDNLPMTSGTAPSANNPARFVQIVVTPITISTFFPATLFGGNNAMTTNAGAVAGFTQAICKPTPIYVCNGTGANDMLIPAAMVGKEVSLVANPGNGQGGNYGFLDALGCGGNTPCLEQTLGQNIPISCINTPQIITTTGQKTAAGDYFDSRFDLYQNSAKKLDPTVYSPDVNVRKGYLPANANGNSACGKIPYDISIDSTGKIALPLPDDSNIAGNYSTATIGNGNWTANFFSPTGYWGVNFPGVATLPPLTTRYALYQYELPFDAILNPTGHNLVPDQSNTNPTNQKTSPGEVGAPLCAPANAQANRRLLYAAVIDCSSLGGGQTSVTALGVVEFFLLRPTIPTGGFGTMLGEYVGVALPNDSSGILHDIVQLYR